MRNDLKNARRKVGLTQTQVGKQIGATQDVVSRYETGKRVVDPDTALRLAPVLKMPVLYVIYGKKKANRLMPETITPPDGLHQP